MPGTRHLHLEGEHGAMAMPLPGLSGGGDGDDPERSRPPPLPEISEKKKKKKMKRRSRGRGGPRAQLQIEEWLIIRVGKSNCHPSWKILVMDAPEVRKSRGHTVMLWPQRRGQGTREDAATIQHSTQSPNLGWQKKVMGKGKEPSCM